MRLLMFTWEFPPLIAGGLGMACFGMVRALLKQGVEIDLVLPIGQTAWFPLRKPEDVKTLPIVFLDPEKQAEYDAQEFETMEDKLDYIGMAKEPETYQDPAEIETYRYIISHLRQEFKQIHPDEDETVWEQLSDSLRGEEKIFLKVQDFTSRAREIALALEYDAIHAHDWLCYGAGMIAKKISGKPLVTHIHATEFDRAGGAGDERIHKIEFAGMTYADCVIAVSRYTAEMIIARYRLDTGKIRIVHNAYIVKEDLDKHKQNIFSGTVILFLGRITVQKGPEYFLEVARRVLKKHPETWFIMAGTGDMARKIIYKSAELRLGNHFLFTGFLNREEVDRILRASDIYMLPSISEPFGIAPLEAMAYGVTAIISKQSGVAEVVQNAYKVDFWKVDEMTDRIIHLIENPELRKQMGADGMKEVQQIEWDNAAVKIVGVYQDTIRDYQKRKRQ